MEQDGNTVELVASGNGASPYEEEVPPEGLAPEEEEEEEIVVVPVQQPVPPPRVTAAASRAAGVAGGAVGAGLYRVGSAMDAPEEREDEFAGILDGPDKGPGGPADISDLVSVSEEDVFGEGGKDMSDLLEVSDADIMGEDEEEESAPVAQPVARPLRVRRAPPSGLSGMQY